LGARLLRNRVGDVRRGDRTEQSTLATGPGLDRDRPTLELRGQRLRAFTVATLTCLPVAAHRVRLLLAAGRSLQREAPRHEVVTRVAIGDVDDLALLAQVV